MSAQKRLLSLLLALCMVLALVPAAFAEDGPAYLDPETEPSELMEEEAMGDAVGFNLNIKDNNNPISYPVAGVVYDMSGTQIANLGTLYGGNSIDANKNLQASTQYQFAITYNSETRYYTKTTPAGGWASVDIDLSQDTYSTTLSPTTYKVTFTTNTAATVRVYSDEEKTTQVGEDVDISSTTGTINLEGGTYYYTATPANTTLYEVATDQFTVTDSSSTVVITMTQKAAPVGGYLYTSNADLLSSLMWNIYFHIDENVIDTPANAVVVVTSENDETARGNYPLQAGTGDYADYYYITVPIRPRLIGENIGLRLTYNDANYKLKKSVDGANEYVTANVKFDSYLTSLLNKNDQYSGVITALRDYRDALVAMWAVE